jgi:RNA polymerase sigma-70 factor (ECF subfamily)
MEPVVAPDELDLAAVETYESFFRREYRGLVALAYALAGQAVAEDVAQEAMLAAYRRWPEVSRLDLPVAWVRRVCVNIAVSQLRRRGAELRAVGRWGRREPTASELPESDAALWALVRRLPRRQAQVLALHYVCDASVLDVADVLGLSEGSVKVHLSRGRGALAARLADVADRSVPGGPR